MLAKLILTRINNINGKDIVIHCYPFNT